MLGPKGSAQNYDFGEVTVLSILTGPRAHFCQNTVLSLVVVSFPFLLLEAIQRPHTVAWEWQTVWKIVGLQPRSLEEDRELKKERRMDDTLRVIGVVFR